ncbi:TonB-dependent receptor domain-containing protein [Vibrio europaeus]|uniref:TonB-dependent receptor domain-containing protein n=1 Tax=Vibrio europaeus TaxID=300876 RepID=UPI0039DFC16F
MNRSILAIAVASLLPHASLSYAQEASADETMVVTANRFEQSVDSVLAPVSVVTREEIEQLQAKSLIDVLKRLPGIEYQQYGGRGQNASIFIRGTNSNHALVLLDGVRINSSAGGVTLNKLPIGIVERLEVLRGPQAARYGSDAVGGVINIITRVSNVEERQNVNVGAGSNNYKEASGSVKTKISDSSSLMLGGAFESSDGYAFKPTTNDSYGYEGKNIIAGYEKKINDSLKAYVSALWFDSHAEYDSFGTKKNSFTDNQNVAATLEYNSGALQSSLLANHQVTKSYDYSNSEGKNGAKTQSIVDLTTAQWANLYQLNETTSLGGGIDWRREHMRDGALYQYGTNGKNDFAGETRDTTGLYASGSHSFGKAVVEANARVDKHDRYGNQSTWSIAGGYHLTEQYLVKASYGTAFKAPSYTSLGENSSLNPEESKNVEVGLVASYDTWRWNASIYDNKVDNLIIWYQDISSQNVDARIRGIEFDAQFETGFLSHNLVLEYKKHEDEKGVQLARRAKENVKWIGQASFGDVDASLTYMYLGKRLNLPTTVSSKEEYLPAVSLWDLAMTYWVSDTLQLKGRVDNLFDEKYETAKDYTAPGRTVYVSMSYKF